ncbi:glycosyltransferase family 39 protein [Candidatus Poribacteria bacterium]|nr:glycosyltransferase family 39 protein [Candidatus Poribacteria bacterium]
MVFTLFLFRIGSKDFWTAAEARTALIAQSMISSGDWVVPRINGEPYLTKPPLYHWLVALLGAGGRTVTEQAAVLPAALSAIACIGATMWLAARIFGSSAGLWSGVALATMPRFFWQGRVSEIDMTLTLSIVLCMLAFHHLRASATSRQKILSTIFFSLALSATAMLKGPPGILVALFTVVVYGVLRRERTIWGIGRFLLGLAIFLALVIPWPVAVITRLPSALAFFFHESTVKMYSPEAHRHWIFYYVPQIIAGAFPWVCFLPAALWWPRLRDRRSEAFLPVVWAGVVLVFFTMVKTKQSHYVMPLYPALAILVGGALSSLTESGSEFGRTRLGRYTMVVFLAGIVSISIAVPIGIAVRLSASPAQIALCSTGVIFALASVILYKRGKVTESVCVGAMFMFVCLLFAIVIAVPLVNKEMSPRPFAHEVARRVPVDASLGMLDDVRPHVLYYVGREVKPVSASAVEGFLSAGGSGSYLVIPEKAFSQLAERERLEVVVSYKDFKYQNHKYLLITHKK